jgi:hypothetical protein
MSKTIFLLMLGCILLLYTCKQKPPQTTANEGQAEQMQTEAEALLAVRSFLQDKPDAGLYQIDSAQAIDIDTHWQILVPRTDWANRMPNRAAFEVDKRTGKVSIRPVK